MKYVKKRYEIRGLGIERLLDGLQKAGIPLYDVRRVQAHCVRFSVPLDQCAQAEGFAADHGFSVAELPDSGSMRQLNQLKRRWLFLPLLTVAIAVLMLSLQFIWRIEVIDAGIYGGEVLQYLAEANIHPGVRKQAVDLHALTDGLQYRLPQIAWASAEIQGITLRVQIIPGVPTPDLSANIGGQPADVIAACDGIIEKLDVYAGTAKVKAGDTVRKGQVLIEGLERGRLGNEYRPVPARGRVLARTWVHAQAASDMLETRSTPTGNTSTQSVLRCPWYAYSAEDEPNYLTCDMETRRTPIGGAWVPLWVESKTYTEVALERFARPLEDLQAECGLAAMQKIFSLCNNKDEIIDKNIIFSMIEGETIFADAYAELLTEIGRAVPQTTD